MSWTLGSRFLTEQSKQENNRNYLLTQKSSRVQNVVFLKEGIEMYMNHELSERKIYGRITEVGGA
jgi:hypothetical protein